MRKKAEKEAAAVVDRSISSGNKTHTQSVEEADG
jgi:hypothetical protein